MFSINRILNSTFSTRTKTLAPAPSHPQAPPTNRLLPDGCLSLMCLPNTHTSIPIAHKQAQTLPCEKNQPIACTSNPLNAQIDSQITPPYININTRLNLHIRDKDLSPQKITLNTPAAERHDVTKREENCPLTSRQKQALNHGLQHPDGSPNLTALGRYRRQSMAVKLGFIYADGSPNLTALRRYQKQKTALNAGLTYPDGSPNFSALTRNQKQKTALKRGFTHPDGSPDLTALARSQKQNTALKHGFQHPDGTANITQFRRHESKKRAVKAGFIQTDGSADLKAYYRYVNQKTYQRRIKREAALKK